MEELKIDNYEMQNNNYYYEAFNYIDPIQHQQHQQQQQQQLQPQYWAVPTQPEKPRIIMVNQSDRYTKPRNVNKSKRKRVISYEQRKAANVRERRRMCNLNESFDYLRQRLPIFNYERRLSRIETLRLAITYIGFLTDVVGGKNPDEVDLIPMPKYNGEKKRGRGGRRLKTHAHNIDENDGINAENNN